MFTPAAWPSAPMRASLNTWSGRARAASSASADREALAQRDLDRPHGQDRRRSRRRCGEPDEYVSGHVHRCGDAPAAAEQHHRGTFGPGDQAHRPAHGLRNGARREHSRSSAWAASSPRKMPWNSCWRAPRPSQVGTASYADPRAVERLARGLESWCRGHQVERVASLTGALEPPQR